MIGEKRRIKKQDWEPDRRAKIHQEKWVFPPLLKWQEKVINDPHRFKIVCGGRRLGKTYAAKRLIHKTAFENPGCKIYLIYPTLKQAKKNLWAEFKKDFHDKRPYFKRMDSTLLEIEYANGSRLLVYGLENPDSIRGNQARLVICDEFQDVEKLDVFQAAVMPLLTTTIENELKGNLGELYVFGTAKGRNIFYDLIQQQKTNPNYKIWILPTPQNAPQYSETELNQMKNSVAPAIWQREYLCSFDSFEGLIYNEYNPQIHLDVLPTDQSGNRIMPDKTIIGLDVGFSHNSALIVVQKFGDLWFAVSELVENKLQTGQIIDAVKMRAKDYNASIVYVSKDQPRVIEELKRNIPGLAIVGAENNVADGISQIRDLLHFNKEYKIPPKLYIQKHPITGVCFCPQLHKEFLSYSYKGKTEEPHKINDDAVDALRYAIVSEIQRSRRTTQFSNNRPY